MRAAIFRKGEIVVGDVAEPKPGKGQILVKTLACGICGTDLHARVHAEKMVEMSRYLPWRKPMDLSRDVVFGHEFCCEVLECGPGTSGKVKPGQRVVSIPRLIVDGRVEGIGYSNDNPGAYAERLLLSEELVQAVPDHVSNEAAALTEPLAVGIHAVEMAALKGGEVPLVIGCGPIGLSVIAALKWKGVAPIVVSDYSASRREMALKLGADVAIDPAKTSPYKAWEEHARLSPAEQARRGPSILPGGDLKPAVIFECVGVPGVIESIFEGAPQSARVIVVGVCMEPDRQMPMYACFKELSLQYVLAWTPAEFTQSLELIASGRVDVTPMVTGKVGLGEVAGAFAELASPNRHTKILVEPWRS
jgi:threonine dehydrogenase-like Zn-dependent dehydrogenase